MAEKELESDDYVLMLPGEEGVQTEPEEIADVSSRLHRMLMELTTADANAAVRRCRDENGLLAWKRLCANQNPPGPQSYQFCLQSWEDSGGKEDGHHD